MEVMLLQFSSFDIPKKKKIYKIKAEMDEYPNSDEEFELMHQDELEVLKEYSEFFEEPKETPKRQLNFVSETTPDKLLNNGSIPSKEKLDDSFQTDFVLLPNSQNDSKNSSNVSNVETIDETSNKRRRNDELSAIIDHEDTQSKKRQKSDLDFENTILINQILHLRQKAKEKSSSMSLLSNYNTEKEINLDVANISMSVPKYPCVTVTKENGEKLFVRCHSENFEKEEISRIVNQERSLRLLGDSSKDLWVEANKIINEKVERDNINLPENTEESDCEILNISTLNEDKINNNQLWVDLYKPKNYLQLLSDESTNRLLLKWLKLWDKVVFKRTVIPKYKQVKNFKNQVFQKPEVEVKFDEHGRPEKKVALLCGPPGLGKTTLAHIVAKQAGYHVVEVNASDDRSVDSFKTILKNATEMRSLIDKENRPNCLIFDEIDGAPSSSIDFLVKFVNGSVVAKSKKGSNRKQNFLKRPIICICNDVYVPALKPLRQISFVINFPQTHSGRLAERLKEIALQQGIKTDLGTLLALTEKSNNDIRSCISVLHFFKSLSKIITLSDVKNTNIGQKDLQKGLFSVWQDIFQIERSKETSEAHKLKDRMKKVLNVVNSFGDYEKLAQGVFENYTKVSFKDANLEETSEALSWFSYFDILNNKIRQNQDYSLMRYLPYAFVVWHFVFGSPARPKLNYPNADYEARIKYNKNLAIVKEVLREMQTSIRIYVTINSLFNDILPLLVYIITAKLRPVTLHLFTPKEIEDLQFLVNVMIDYNLTYIQERQSDGNYSYELDPNINEVAYFSFSKPSRTLSYATKQIIAQEIELEKIRRSNIKSNTKTNTDKTLDQSKTKTNQVVPNHLQKLKPKIKSPKEMETLLSASSAHFINIFIKMSDV